MNVGNLNCFCLVCQWPWCVDATTLTDTAICGDLRYFSFLWICGPLLNVTASLLTSVRREWFVILFHARWRRVTKAVKGSNLGQDRDYFYWVFFHGFPLFLQTNIGTAPHIRPRPLPFRSFSVSYSLSFSSILYAIVKITDSIIK
jgi:hypothetical protein